MRICSKCGTDNHPNSCFCVKCGVTLDGGNMAGTTVVLPGPRPVQPPQAVFPSGSAGTQVPPGCNPGIPCPWPALMEPGLDRELTILANDVSDSMSSRYDSRKTKLEAVIHASGSYVINKGKIDPNDEIGLVTFNSKAQTLLNLCPIGTSRQQIIAAIQSLTPHNGTDIDAGLKAADAALEWHRPGVVRRIILQTDGQGGDPLRTAESLKARGVVIDVVGVGETPSNVDEKLLRKVASVVQGELRYRFIKDHQTLVNYYTMISGKTKVA